MFLPDNFFAAIELKGQNAFYGQGAVLVSSDSILKVNDLSFELSNLRQLNDNEFIEVLFELHGIRALLLVYSNGTVKFLTENETNGVVEIKETGSKFTNLIGSQLHQVSDDLLLNVRRDRYSELYRIKIENETQYDLCLIGVEKFRVPSIC